MKTNRLYRRVELKMRRKAVRRRVMRSGLLLSNIVILIIVLVFVSQTTNSQVTITQSTVQSTSGVVSNLNPVDQISAVDIAQTVTSLTNLPETPLVNGQAIAQQVAKVSLVGDAGSSVLSKPQVVTSAFKSNQDIQTYVVQDGDTVASLAAKFGVTSDSIRWSNNVYGNSLNPGKTLFIPPVTGIVYTVKAGDTPTSLAQTYGSSDSLIVAYNDAELAGLQVGTRIIIPSGSMSTSVYYGFGYSSSAAGSYTLYAQWNCTWWVALRWSQTGRPIMPLLYNAYQWYDTAKADGLDVSEGGSHNNTPRVHAAAETIRSGWGHVAFVESINADGSVNLSEMNVSGLNVWGPRDPTVTRTTVSADEASKYLYIY